MAATSRALTWNDRPLGISKQFLPADTGVSAVNLKAAPGVIAGALILDVTLMRLISISIKQTITVADASAGAFDLEGIGYAEDGATVLVPATKLWTGIDSLEAFATSPYYAVLSCNLETGDIFIVSTSTSPGTIGVCKAFRGIGKIKFQLNITTSSVGPTVHTASMTVRAST